MELVAPVIVLILTLLNLSGVVDSDSEDDEPNKQYLGTRLGRFTAFSHQVDGEVYAINTTAFLLKNFYYDGTGRDTYFWVGSSNHADRRVGYPLPDEDGTTNVLKRYVNEDLTLILPDNKKTSELRWFAIYDVAGKTAFAEVVFPEDFEPPGHRILQELTRNSHGVKSNPVLALDSKTLQITDLNYDGLGPDTYFWVGYGPVPTSRGMKIPDENGYLEPLRPYKQANITLQLPGNMTIFQVDWLSIFNVATRENYGSMLFPKELNVPPSLVKGLPYSSKLLNCEQLHQKLQLNWQIVNPPTSMIVEIAGQIEENDYVAFGFSDNSKMIGSKVLVIHANGTRPSVEEYYITEKSACYPIPADNGTQFKGVCPQRLYGTTSTPVRVHKALREEGVTVVNFTIPIKPGSIVEPDFLGRDLPVVWAMGHLNHKAEPLYHYLRNTGNVFLNLDPQPPAKRCFPFTVENKAKIKLWERLFVSNPQLTVFNITLGPAAGSKGYEGITGMPSPGLVWYINGLLAPELYVKRGQKYTFSIEGGDDILQPGFHHPFYITNDVRGGYETLLPQDKKAVQFFAGISFDHRGRPFPTAAGRLCVWENQHLNPRNWDEYPTFRRFQATLRLNCQPGKPFLLEWTPNGTIPNVVYYQSFRQQHMGWKIHVMDVVRASGGPPSLVPWQERMLTLSLAYSVFVLSRRNSQ